MFRGSCAADARHLASMTRTTSLTCGEYRRLFEEWSRRYLSSPTAWKIAGRPICAFNNLVDFVTRYGQTTFAVMLRYASQIVEREIGIKPYLLGVIGQANIRNAHLANALPIDGVTGYGLLPNWLGTPIQDYGRLIEERVSDWEQLQKRIRIPFYPVVCTGWDATTRGSFRGSLSADDGYPYSPVVVGVTPERFGYFLDCALAFNRRWQPRENIVFLHAWNEWTESSVLEPSDRFGPALLEEVGKRANQVEILVRDA
jgi:Glycosyltransferase WbsX